MPLDVNPLRLVTNATEQLPTTDQILLSNQMKGPAPQIVDPIRIQVSPDMLAWSDNQAKLSSPDQATYLNSDAHKNYVGYMTKQSALAEQDANTPGYFEGHIQSLVNGMGMKAVAKRIFTTDSYQGPIDENFRASDSLSPDFLDAHPWAVQAFDRGEPFDLPNKKSFDTWVGRMDILYQADQRMALIDPRISFLGGFVGQGIEFSVGSKLA